MSEADITKEQKQLLRPFADRYASMYAEIVEMPDEALSHVLDACKATSQTNCGWDVYAAAKWVSIEIDAEMYRRSFSIEKETP